MPAKGNKCCCGSPPDPWPPGVIVVCAVENITVPDKMSVVLPGNDNAGLCCNLYPGDYTLNRVSTSSTGPGCITTYRSTELDYFGQFSCSPGSLARVTVGLTYTESTGDVQCQIFVYGAGTDWSRPSRWETTILANGPNLVRSYSCPHATGATGCYSSPPILDANPA